MPKLGPAALAARAVDHPWRTVVAWLLVLAASAVCTATLLGDALTTDATTTNHAAASQARDLMDAHPMSDDSATEASEFVVIRARTHRVGDPAFQRFVDDLAARTARIGVRVTAPAGSKHDTRTPTELDPPAPEEVAATLAALPHSSDEQAVLVPLAIAPHTDSDVAVDRLLSTVEDADRDPDFSVAVSGALTADHDLNELAQHDLEHGELGFGLPIALVVLVLVFGALVGALLPVVLAIVAIVVALGLTSLVGLAFELNTFLVNMLSGMGLALGIDYSLFILSRYREERLDGHERDAAIRAAGATASRAVLFSGLTFVIALSGMLLVQTTIMRSLALGAILAAIACVAAALTLLPALLRLLGDRVDALSVPFVGTRHRSSRPGRSHVAHAVMRHPGLYGGAALVLLIALALPALDGLGRTDSGVGTLPEHTASRQGYDALRRDFPQAAARPARVVVLARGDRTARDPAITNAVGNVVASLSREPDYRGAPVFGPPTSELSTDGKLLVVSVPVGLDPTSEEAIAAVRELRDDIVPGAFRSVREARALVGGTTALEMDYFDVMDRWTVPVFIFVLGLSFVLLTVVFRSLVVPLKAIVLNLLSVGATYGLLVLVFKRGVGNDLLGFEHVDAIEAWVPLFLFAVLFGLSMDYHMFLLTRIRERWARTGDTAEAVGWGIGTTSRLITGAALIIVAVFVGFARGELVMFQEMGFGVAVALLLDATVVRLVLLPAAMVLLGDSNWYLPSWLRWLPELQLEAEPTLRDGSDRG